MNEITLTEADLVELAAATDFDELMDTTAVSKRPALRPLESSTQIASPDAAAAFVEWAAQIPTLPSIPEPPPEGRINRRMNVLLTERLDVAVSEAAKEADTSQSEIVRRALREYLAQNRKGRAA